MLILGKTGSGKSFLAKRLLKKFDRYIIYDTQGEYTDGVVFERIEELYNFLIKVGDYKFRCIYNPLNIDTEISEICRFAYLLGDCCVLCEEIDLYCSPSYIDPDFNNIVRRGRHKGVSIIALSQRPVGINKIITSQFSTTYSFFQDEPRDIDYLRDRFGKSVNILPHLNFKSFEYAKFSDNKVSRHNKYDKPLTESV